jgi:hypothetical protein
MAENAEIIAEFSPRVAELVSTSHTMGAVRRCSRCQVRKVLEVAFYRDRKSRGGYRRECKRCRNASRNEWSRRRTKTRQAINRRRSGGRVTKGQVK